MKETPHVTALMVTGKDLNRFPLARRAVHAFLSQTYKNASLLIINDHPSGTPLLRNNQDANVQEVLLPAISDTPRSLGELRNIAIEEARSREINDGYLMQWDDDDYSRDDRIAYQIANTPAGGASIFRYELHVHLQQRCGFVNNGRTSRVRGFAGTMCWASVLDVAFPLLGKHEDTEFLLTLQKKCTSTVLENDPRCYTRFYHGYNTWGEKHVMNRKPGSRDCNPTEQRYIDQLLQDKYAGISGCFD